jgi:hypothetical protein
MANTRTGRERTAAAVAANRRRRQDRIAAELRDAGWYVLSPEDAEWRRRIDAEISDRALEPAGPRRVEFRAAECAGQLALAPTRT